jgi:hypothetical protein
MKPEVATIDDYAVEIEKSGLVQTSSGQVHVVTMLARGE